MNDPGRATRTVILDCDPGTDDALAVLLALASPELEVAAITVAGGNAAIECTLANASGLVALAGANIPVHPGAAAALLGPYPPGWPGHGSDGMAGIKLPPGGAPAEALAPDAIRALLRASSRPVTLIAIGPATNLALALATEPSLVTKIDEIVLMSGAAGRGNATPSAEFNAWCDPEALAIVLALQRKLTLATLETGRAARLTAQHLALFRAAGGRAATTAAAILAALLSLSPDGAPLYDPCAVAWLIAPALFTARPVFLGVGLGPGPGRGRMLIDHHRPANASVLEPLDPDALFALLASRLANLP
ncbi:MAG: nucleoside hydrolase [Acetobacteraceae bacterium]